MAEAKAQSDWPMIIRQPDFKERIKTAKVLCVGAGGIGCELLKTLVLTGFQNIEVIDLDTIETSNLNRQFLFRRHHVGQSKAQVAADVVRSFAPNCIAITWHQANVKESRFDVDYFKSFDIVLNGLDNMEARRHVNRQCLAAGTPLVESGTTGYIGQVTVHLKGQTECYECQQKPVPKSFPICTLRNTPDKPIHCIVWSKDLLFQRLFGKPEAVTDLDERSKEEEEEEQQQQQQQQQEGADGQAVDGEAAAAAAAAAAEEASFFQRRPEEAPLQYACRIFTRVFTTDIERVICMTELWKTRTPPAPLRLEQLLPDVSALGSPAAGARSACRSLGLADAQAVWSLEDSARVFIRAIVLFLQTRPDEVGSAQFDKDDDLAVELVAAASNLRAACYGIKQQSLFQAKGMAGNIIHAIATTNAIVSGLIVTEACKILAGLSSCCRNGYVKDDTKERVITAGRPCEPSKDCVVCGTAMLTLRINTATATLGELLEHVIGRRLALSEPMLLCEGFMYEEGEGLEEDELEANAALLPRPLRDLPGGGLRHGSILAVHSGHVHVQLVISHQDAFDQKSAPEGFILEGAVPAAAAARAANGAADSEAAQGAGTSNGEAAAAAAPAAAPAAADSDSDELEILEPPEAGETAAPAAPAAGGKRSRDGQAEQPAEPGAKKAKVVKASGVAGEPIELE